MVVVAGAATPDIIPDAEPMVAAAVLLLVHVPPIAVSLRVAVAPRHTAGVPVIADTEPILTLVVL